MKKRFGFFAFLFLAGMSVCGSIPLASATVIPCPTSPDKVVIGSKIFTESYVLAETAAQILENATKVMVDRKLGMGSTGVLFESLKTGAIDVYPDYTGTLAETILKQPALKSIDVLREKLQPLGLTVSNSLGFNNTYALAVKESFAEAHDLKQMSDLRKIENDLRAAFSYEFMARRDGYHGMVSRYGLSLKPAQVKQMEHSLVYQAIDDGAVDAIEVYSTDANINKYHLRVLKDDRGYFPSYEAVWVARLEFIKTHPAEWAALTAQEGTISEDTMRGLNASADIDKKSFGSIASEFLQVAPAHNSSLTERVLRRTVEHLRLVAIALLFSILIGVPLGIIAARLTWVGQGILLLSALIQTIPALALLCFLIPLFGIGEKPALVALCLYSLLPVVLNTFTGIRSIESKHLENAKAFGLSNTQILTRIELPLASPIILAGVKSATIISIGTATLAALIGAGGYGALIVSGLSLNDVPIILSGAIPAAVMALAAYLIFGVLTLVLVPKGLRK